MSESYGVTLRTRKLTMKQIDKTAKDLKRLIRKAKEQKIETIAN